MSSQPGKVDDRATAMRSRILVACILIGPLSVIADPSPQKSVFAEDSLSALARQIQRRVVKIYGAGGLSGLENYQSGFLVSPEGHIATAWSYVLDVDPIVQLDDGSRFEAKIVDFEPKLELAILKIDASTLPYFEVDANLEVGFGDPVLAASNLFNIATGSEPVSVLQGRIAAVSDLDARRGTFETPYRGPVYILDLVANNPGAAGGALVDYRGRLIGMLGKELRDSATGVWLNYALPSSSLRAAIGDIIAGRSRRVTPSDAPELPESRAQSLPQLGLILIPDVLEATPAYVDKVADASPAALAGVLPDDLLLLINGQRIEHQKSLAKLLRRIDRRDAVELTLQRGSEILSVSLEP